MKHLKYALGAFAIAVVVPHLASGGDCISSLEEEVAYLEQTEYSEETAHHVQIRLFCMRAESHSGSNRWAGPSAAAYIKTCRGNPLRDRITATCQGYLEFPAELKYAAARTLAHYAIGTANDEDIYSILISHRDDPPWFDLAILGDPRTVDFVRDLYPLRRPLGLGKHANTEALIAMLNCLYHIPSAGAVVLAKELLATESDAGLRDRLARVIDRPI